MTGSVIPWLVWGAVFVAGVAQVVNYSSTPLEQRTYKRKFALNLGVIAVVASAIAGQISSNEIKHENDEQKRLVNFVVAHSLSRAGEGL
jgi:hypothetical protein